MFVKMMWSVYFYEQGWCNFGKRLLVKRVPCKFPILHIIKNKHNHFFIMDYWNVCVQYYQHVSYQRLISLIFGCLHVIMAQSPLAWYMVWVSLMTETNQLSKQVLGPTPLPKGVLLHTWLVFARVLQLWFCMFMSPYRCMARGKIIDKS